MMYRSLVAIAIVFVGGFIHPNRSAAASLSNGGFFQGGLYYYTLDAVEKETDTTNQTSKVTETDLNLTLGYSLGSGLLLGVKYISLTKKTRAAPENVQKVSGAGFSLGFFSDGFYAMVSIMSLITPEYSMTGGVTKSVYSNGGGTILDLAYLLDMRGWFLGPQISWQSFEYTKLKVDGVVNSNFLERQTTEIQPYISFLVPF